MGWFMLHPHPTPQGTLGTARRHSWLPAGVEMRGRDCYWPETLLNILQCTGQLHIIKDYPAQMSAASSLGNPAPEAAQSFPASFARSQPVWLPCGQKVCSGHDLPRTLSPGVQPLHRHSQARSSSGHQCGHGDILGILILEWIRCGVHDSVLSPWGSLSSKMLYFIYLFIFYRYYFFGRAACGILVPRPGIRPRPPAVEVPSLNHWTAREFPTYLI